MGVLSLFELGPAVGPKAEAWDAYVRKHRAGSFYHLTGWRRVIERAFGHRPHYLYTERDGAITGADRASGAITIGEVVPVGATVQFLLRDRTAAHEDLSAVLGAVRGSIGLDAVAGALVFSAGARGREMFPTTDHDVAAVRGELGTENVAGFFTSGEIGPLAGRNHVHGFSATVLAFGA